MDDCLVCRWQARQSSIQSDKYQVSHRYSYFSWWWAHNCPKHLEKRNKYITKNCAPSWFYLQDDFYNFQYHHYCVFSLCRKICTSSHAPTRRHQISQFYRTHQNCGYSVWNLIHVTPIEPVGRPRRRWEDNIKMDFQKMGSGGMEWIELA